jgi:hypothetical protein
MPHARHGGNGVRAFAVAGSKFDGTGFEKEQMGHTQVALGGSAAGGAGDRCPSGVLESVDAGGPRESRFAGLGYRVILGEDLRRKPAWQMVRSQVAGRSNMTKHT